MGQGREGTKNKWVLFGAIELEKCLDSWCGCRRLGFEIGSCILLFGSSVFLSKYIGSEVCSQLELQIENV